MSPPRVALVTGASSGIGAATVALLAQRGWEVYAGARNPDSVDAGRAAARIHPVELDLTSAPTLEAAVGRVLDERGGLDALVNVAGYSETGPLECAQSECVRRQLETNALGPLRLAQLALPAMRAQGSGRIVNVGTVMARLPLPLLGLYSASKSTFQAFNDALRVETRRFGVRVIMVVPGTVRSPFDTVALANLRERNGDDRSPYHEAIERLAGMIESSSEKGLWAEAVAQRIHHALVTSRPRATYVMGLDARLTLALATRTPLALRDVALRRLAGL